MKLVLTVALTAILSAGVSTTVVLLAQPQDAQSARSAATTKVSDRAALQELRKLNDRIGFGAFSEGLRGELREQLDPLNKNIYAICRNTEGSAFCTSP